jgi:hypothetical protein
MWFCTFGIASVRVNQYACPDIWFDSLQHYKEQMGKAKTDAEIVAHVLAAAPNNYDLVTTLILGKDLKDKETLKLVQEQYWSYWKRHFKHHQNRRSARWYSNVATAYMIETKDKYEVNAIGRSQGWRMQCDKATGKPWKKFKGCSKNCVIQGHKAANCTKGKGNKEKQVQKETRNAITVIG